MLSEELLKKVKQIEITTRRMVDDVMSGNYRSHFKGHGVQFSEHRLYVPGDDIRHIDWKVSARTRDPLIKKYEEERELQLLLVVDVSGSGKFGSSKKLKSEVIAEVAGMVAYAAIHTGDKVGALFFSSEVERIIPPKKGKKHTQRIVGEILGYRPRAVGTNLSEALDSAGRIMKHGGIVFVLSDFMAGEFASSLKRLARRHDVVAVEIRDERESEVPEIGQLLVVDPETGVEACIDTGSYLFKKWLKDDGAARSSEREEAFKGGHVELLSIQTKEDHGEAVVRFFRARSRRRR